MSLTALYNKKVVTVQKAWRDLQMVGGGVAASVGINHKGIVVTLEDGSRWLVHKAKTGTEDGGHTVITSIQNMSVRWNFGESGLAKEGTIVSNLVQWGGTDYWFLWSNGIKASNAIWRNTTT